MASTPTDRSIKEWMENFTAIYSKADENRTPEQIWIAIMAHASTIGESIRTFSIEALSKSAAHTFCWLCSFINKCNTLELDIFALEKEDLSSVVTLKYPNVCGHCQQVTCQCDSIEIEKKKDKSVAYTELLASRNLLSYSRYTLYDLLSMFKKIYAGRLHIQTLENIGFHFLEEAGEAAFAIRKLSQLQTIHTQGFNGLDTELYGQLTTVESIVKQYVSSYTHIKELKEHPELLNKRDPDILKARVIDAKMGLIIEIGDTFSWLCSISNKLLELEKSIWENPEEHLETKFKDFAVSLNDEYLKNGKPQCPTCESAPCECAFFNEETKKS